MSRTIVVISDLHLGGATATDGTRGFRMTTQAAALAQFITDLSEHHEPGTLELVINGDFVDFLAEERPSAPAWRSHLDPRNPDDLACAIELFSRDAAVFTALGMLARKQRLTILLGNHDIELSLPSIRRLLEAALGAEIGRQVKFIDDNQAYTISSVLIEHGNRYDPWNAVPHDDLRQLRSMLSRGEPLRAPFRAPAGSELVAQVMNQIKQDYPFVDLLKPETGAAIPLLLAFEPRFAATLMTLAKIAVRAKATAIGRPLTTIASGGRAASAPPGTGLDDPDADVQRAIDTREMHNQRGLQDVEAEIAGELPGGTALVPVASRSSALTTALGFWQLITTRGTLGKRIAALRKALGVLANDRTFALDHEDPGYLEAARSLARDPIQHVLFGHTHLAKQIDLGDGRSYLNTGTWADLAELPYAELAEDSDEALETKLVAFLTALRTTGKHPWIAARPYYAQFVVDGNQLVQPPRLVPVTLTPVP